MRHAQRIGTMSHSFNPLINKLIILQFWFPKLDRSVDGEISGLEVSNDHYYFTSIAISGCRIEFVAALWLGILSLSQYHQPTDQPETRCIE